MGRILVGISSWTEESLLKSGGLYPPDVKSPADMLRYYALHFPVTEVDSSYYAMPSRRSVALWLENTPPGFVFNVKAFSLFTQHPTNFNSLPRVVRSQFGDLIPHRGRVYVQQLPEQVVDELWSRFDDAVQPLATAGKLGAILFQFPPWFHPRQENFDYIVKCKEKLGKYRLAVEFRTASWLSEEGRERTLAFLREHGLALVCVDEPQGFKSSVPPVAEVTASFGILRFHGRNAENWERKGAPTTEKFSYLYSEEELRDWVPKIKRMAEDAQEVHVIFKNKHEDFPIRNALQMKQMRA